MNDKEKILQDVVRTALRYRRKSGYRHKRGVIAAAVRAANFQTSHEAEIEAIIGVLRDMEIPRAA